MKTTDLIDKYEDALTIVDISAFRHFGRKREFGGEIVTVKCFEDNTRAKALLETNGKGKVLVVDGNGSRGRALMGDNVAALAISSGWEGAVFYGCIRDSADIAAMDIGVLALGATPRRPLKQNKGETGIELAFAGARFCPGAYIYVDDDGMLLSGEALTV
ncbi:MAG: ribonuclease E activity regulator RraA [Pseudomonadales bacterium]